MMLVTTAGDSAAGVGWCVCLVPALCDHAMVPVPPYLHAFNWNIELKLQKSTYVTRGCGNTCNTEAEMRFACDLHAHERDAQILDTGISSINFVVRC